MHQSPIGIKTECRSSIPSAPSFLRRVPRPLVHDHEHHEYTANAEIFHRTRTSEHASHITHRNRRHSVPATLHGYAFSSSLETVPWEPRAGNGEPVVKGSNARHRKRNGKKYARRHHVPWHFSFNERNPMNE